MKAPGADAVLGTEGPGGVGYTLPAGVVARTDVQLRGTDGRLLGAVVIRCGGPAEGGKVMQLGTQVLAVRATCPKPLTLRARHWLGRGLWWMGDLLDRELDRVEARWPAFAGTRLDKALSWVSIKAFDASRWVDGCDEWESRVELVPVESGWLPGEGGDAS